MKPNQKKDEIVLLKNIITVKIKAAPQKGEANNYLVKYLSSIFHISKTNIQVIKGLTSNHKTISMEISESEFESKICKISSF